ncbi:MAG: hypothetical protein Q8K00_05615 [Syntrophales bacterium]|nr:hypothetical protein [Syntrophales bacterium]
MRPEPAAPLAGAKPLRVYGMIKDPQHPKARSGWVWVVRETRKDASVAWTSYCC